MFSHWCQYVAGYKRAGICSVVFVLGLQLNSKAELIAFGYDFLDYMPGNKDISQVAGYFDKEVGNIFAVFNNIDGGPGFSVMMKNHSAQIVG